MEFLGLGPMEILIVFLIALAVFGPQRMVDIARKAGRFVRQISKIGSEVTKTLSEENLPAQGKQTVQDLRKIGTDLRQTVADALQPAQEAVKPAVPPPSQSVPVAGDSQKAAVPVRPAFDAPPQNPPTLPPVPQQEPESKSR